MAKGECLQALTVKREPGPADTRVLCVKKANYAPTGLELRLLWSAGVFKADEDAGSLRGVDAQMAELKIEQVFLTLLDVFAAQGRNVTDTTGRGFAPAEFAREPSAKGITSRGFEAAMRRLFASGQIGLEEFGPPSRRRRRLVRRERA